MLKKFFLSKLFVPLIKGNVSSQFYVIFGRLNFDVIPIGTDLTKIVKILHYIKRCQENIFLSELFVPLIKGSASPQLKAIFGKLNFWQNINRRWPNKNDENFVLFEKVLKKLFLSKLFVPLIKGSVSPQFWAIFGKLNFWRNIDRCSS